MDINFKVKDDKFKVKSVNLCDYMDEYWAGTLSVNVDGQERTPIELLPKVFPGKDNAFASEFVVLEKYVNGMKERMWSGKQLVDDDKMRKYINDNADNNKAFKKTRDIISAWKYHQDGTTKDILKKQSDRVAAAFDSLESAIAKKDNTYTRADLKDAWNSFMKGRADKARAGAETFLDSWLQQMNDAWIDGDENSNPNTGSDPNSKASRLTKLKKERDGMGTWSIPLKRHIGGFPV